MARDCHRNTYDVLLERWSCAESRDTKYVNIPCIVSMLHHSVTISVLFYVLSRHFLFYFEKVTNFPLLFQVTCPSSRVRCLIVFPDSQSVSTCSPWSLMCSNSLRIPLSRARMLSPFMSLTSRLLSMNHSHSFPEPGVERSSSRAIVL